MLENITEPIIAIFSIMGVVIASGLTIQWANNLSRNMSLTNKTSNDNIAKD